MSGKLRVYEVARDLGLDNKALVALLQSVGYSDVKNHMSAVTPDVVERVKRHLKRDTGEKVVEERIAPTVVKRRARARSAAGDTEAASSPTSAPAPVPQPVGGARAVVRRKPAAAPATEASASRAPDAESSPVSAPASARQPASRRPASGPVASPAPIARESEPTQPEPAPVSRPVTKLEPESKPSAEPKVERPAASSRAPAAAASAEPEVAAEPVQPAPAAPSRESKPASVPAAAASANGERERERVSAPAPAPTTIRAASAPSAPVAAEPAPAPQPRPAPKTGIDVWEGRPGVPMPKAPRGGPGPRRVQYDAKAGAGPQGRGRGPMVGGPMRGRGMRHRGIGSLSRAKGTGGPVTQERSAHKKVVRIEETIGLQALGGKIGVKATELLMTLMRLGMTGVNINTTLDADTAKIVANEFGWEVEDVAVSEQDAIVAAQGSEAGEESDENLESRPPVVTVMGHVDHGKTSLLDQIRKTNVVSGEAGGITQHIGAYSVKTAHGPLTFLDTPGHEAFTQMRARGAQATDIVILVVAADDGVMPQTKEAIAHARAAGVPIVVAINKCDKPDAQPERVRRELSEQGLVPEEWGGDVLFNEVSAATRQGIDDMLEKVVLQAELLELRANPDKPATGIVVEAELDRGKGPVATVLVTDGTLRRGDVILAGAAYGKARAMIDSSGKQVQKAGPSMPVSLIGLNEVPTAGDQVYVIKDMKTAQELAEGRKTKAKVSLTPSAGNKPRTLEDIAALMSEAEQLELKVIIKADVQGSAEAVSDSLARLSGDKVRVSVVHSAAGAITENDVNLAVAAGAVIIGFNVRPAGKAQSLAQREGVQIRQYNIIYNVVDDVKAAMEGLLAPKMVEKTIGKAEVRQTFKVTKAGTIAGCMIVDGVVKRSAGARLLREGAEVYAGKLSSLKRFKDDVKEVKEGFDCGIALEGFNDIKIGDIIECFEVEEVKQSL